MKNPVRALEQAQKQAAKQLAETRKRIRKQATLTSYEYCLLHEDDVAAAKAGAERIDGLMVARPITVGTPTLMLARTCDDFFHLVLAKHPLLTLRAEEWEVHGTHHLAWDDRGPSLLQTMAVTKLDTGKWAHHNPLHQLLANPGCFIAFGERDVAERLLSTKKGENGKPPHYDRFNFFFSLTKQLGYELKDKKLKKRVEEERERVASDCCHHLKSLAGVLDEFFVHGARGQPIGRTTSDGSAMLISRAHNLAQEMSLTMSECRLYGVDTEESREIKAFGKRWIPFFNLGQEDKT